MTAVMAHRNQARVGAYTSPVVGAQFVHWRVCAIDMACSNSDRLRTCLTDKYFSKRYWLQHVVPGTKMFFATLDVPQNNKNNQTYIAKNPPPVDVKKKRLGDARITDFNSLPTNGIPAGAHGRDVA